ncbi:carboxypeptidase-like regulatory domain-containing protein [Leminorella grimontii]|uniref:carboxypeptidase-like regulatory domain-containing protein n=1 Tax=Leminorella grimontii TaxID=82981 RepID=UPI0021C469DD|nr:carboxypeptidase-like regulatory domain-containing protein [Leminorella grimontii]
MDKLRSVGLQPLTRRIVMNGKNVRPLLLLLSLCLFLLNGCLPRTIYPRGETSGAVVDAMTHKPIGGALVTVDAHKAGSAVTDENGAFHITEIKDWEMVPFMAGQAPYDSKRCNVVTVSAQGYKTRRWVGQYSTNYAFPIQLLPESSALEYQTTSEDAWLAPLRDSAPPHPPEQEAFVIKSPTAPPTAATE